MTPATPMLDDSLTFWLAAAAMIAVALAFVLPRLLGRVRADATLSRDRLNAVVYRAELAELDTQRAAGTLAPPDYDRARAEVERRLLEDVPEARELPTRGGERGLGIVVAIVLPLAAVALYLAFGAPAMIAPSPDDTTPPAVTAGDDYRGRLRAHLAASPRDGRAWVALARLEMDDDRFADAARSYAQAIAVAPKIARDAGVLCEYADALGMAQGGKLEGQPAELVERALALDPVHPKALEMAGSAAYERGDFRAAVRHWRTLLAQLAAGSPAHGELASAIERAERLAATRLPPPPGGNAQGG